MTITEQLKVRGYRNPQRLALLDIMYTGYRLTSGINSVLKPFGLTEPQFNVLATIYAALGTPVSSSSIQDGMIQTESNVTRIVDKLVSRGWVDRQICPKNRRKVDITVTDEGRRVFRNAAKAVNGFQSKVMGTLDPENLNRLAGLLEEIRDGAGEKE